MYEEVLKKIKSKISNLEYVVTIHAEEEISDDFLSIYDVEQAIFTGSILEPQRDKITAEYKYRIRGLLKKLWTLRENVNEKIHEEALKS